jgi:hypothetical protein
VPGERANDGDAIFLKDTGGKSDDCAWKAIELISGDLLRVSDS